MSSSLLQCRAAVQCASSEDEIRAALKSIDTLGVAASHKSIKQQHKRYYGAISKLGKNIDKNFLLDLSPLCSGEALDNDPVNVIIATHLLREGHFAVADSFIEEAGVVLQAGVRDSFVKLHTVLQAFDVSNVQPAIDWAVARREALSDIHCDLEFELHRLRFLQILHGLPSTATTESPQSLDPVLATIPPSSALGKNHFAAILYARKHFSIFAQNHSDDIGRLMGSVLYTDSVDVDAELTQQSQGLDTPESPYVADLNEVKDCVHIRSRFVEAFCRVNHLPSDSALSVTVDAGVVAVPKLLRYYDIMKNAPGVASERSPSNWTAMEQLPVDVKQGDEVGFHSVFTCPVSREQSDSGNPPVLLKCGHVIARQSMLQIANSAGRFKCPTCPCQQNISDSLAIRF